MLILTHEADTMLKMAASYESGLEVGGFGHTRISDNGEDIICDAIYIPPQEVQAAHTDIKGPGEAGGDGQLEAAMFHWSTLCRQCGVHRDLHEGIEHDFEPQSWVDNRLWWHSHGTIGASPSATDDSTLHKLARLLGGWSVGLVINSKHERYAWAAVHEGPLAAHFKIEFGTYRQDMPELQERVNEMMKEVKRKVWASSTYQGNGNFTRGGTGPTTGTSSGHQTAHPNDAGHVPGNNVRRIPRSPMTGTKAIKDMSPAEFQAFLAEQGLEELPLLPAGGRGGYDHGD